MKNKIKQQQKKKTSQMFFLCWKTPIFMWVCKYLAVCDVNFFEGLLKKVKILYMITVSRVAISIYVYILENVLGMRPSCFSKDFTTASEISYTIFFSHTELLDSDLIFVGLQVSKQFAKCFSLKCRYTFVCVFP